MRYAKLLFGQSPKPLSWKESFKVQVSGIYDSLINYSTNVVNFITCVIPESIQYYCTELYYSWDSTSTLATVLTCITVLACILAALYYLFTLSKDLKNAETSLKNVDKMLTDEIVTQAKILESVNISTKANEDINMTVYMSEKRRKSKDKCPERPIELEDRAPELMPGLRAERCVKDGLAVLNIVDNESTSEENIAMEYTSLKLGQRKGISLEECLKTEQCTLQFVNDTPLDVFEESTNKNVQESLPEGSAEVATRQVYNETQIPRPKLRPVSRNTIINDKKNSPRRQN